LGDAHSIAILHQVLSDERGHFSTLACLIRSGPPLPELTPDQANLCHRDWDRKAGQ
jgi:hypothetical protein